ncbi:Uncharacterised protein [Yersinia enterocolitica]|nr:Uncharacterised protein [Yersinia enterocolitica]
MALARGFTGHLQAVRGGTQVDILRLYIHRASLNIGPHGGEIVDVGR